MKSESSIVSIQRCKQQLEILNKRISHLENGYRHIAQILFNFEQDNSSHVDVNKHKNHLWSEEHSYQLTSEYNIIESNFFFKYEST